MKSMLRKVLPITIAIAMAATAVGCGSKQAPAPAASGAPASSAPKADPIKIGISHTSSLESPWNKASLKFAEIVNNESKGALKVEVFGNGVLNQKNWKVMFEQTQSGSNAIAIESLTALSSVVEETGAISIPFLFKDAATFQKFLDSNPAILQKFLKKFEEKNLVVITTAPRPFRQNINSQRNIKTPEDIKGMKFRVPQNPTFVKIFESMGAKPVPLASGEIYSSIQLGTVVGEDNSIPVVYDFKTHEVAKFMTIWDYIADMSMMVMNKDIYNKMSDEQKALLKKAGKEWSAVNIKEDTDYTKVAKEKMEQAGVKFYEMPAKDKEPFKALMKPVYADFQKLLGDADWKALNDAVEAAGK